MADQHKKAGLARLERMTPERRREVASAGAQARWAKADPERDQLPRAEFGDDKKPLKIGEIEIPCYVLDDERRVLTVTGMQRAMNMAVGGSMVRGLNRFELFTSGERIKPYVFNDLAERVRNPIIFITPTGGRAYGYEAETLVELCEAVLAARAAGVLQKQQLPIAQQCELIIRGLARVGIVALVDEATGFQEVRKRDALHKILEAYIAPDLLPWTQRFPSSFYEEMFRLHDWPYDPASVKRPGVVGKFTNQFIYERLPEGVLEELKRKNPKDDLGRRRLRHHQFLTEDVGHPHLEKQITKTITLMQASDNWAMFKRLFSKVFPKPGDQTDLIPDN
ncbi:MAG: hypothetical protein C0458_05605 [Methylobacterium sp.]|nr:hypothetical protein [Methylobacterium sp.]